jgi:myosin XV
LTPLQCKAQFLSILSNWPLFGSSFFAVKRVFGDDIGAIPDDDSGAMWRELILALNFRGVLFLDSNTHETLHHWNFIEIISTRKVRFFTGILPKIYFKNGLFIIFNRFVLMIHFSSI